MHRRLQTVVRPDVRLTRSPSIAGHYSILGGPEPQSASSPGISADVSVGDGALGRAHFGLAHLPKTVHELAPLPGLEPARLRVAGKSQCPATEARSELVQLLEPHCNTLTIGNLGPLHADHVGYFCYLRGRKLRDLSSVEMHMASNVH